MHFGAAVRSVLSTTCGSDLGQARGDTVIPELRSPETQRILAANLARAFGVAIPDRDLDRLITVRDVLQCVRLHRWVLRVDRAGAGLTPGVSASAPADADVHTTSAADAPQYHGMPGLRRRPSTSSVPLSPTDPPPAGRREERH
jgi:hypothetical protein